MPLLWEMRKTKPERARQVQAACGPQCPSRTGVRGARGLRHKQGRVRTQALSLWVGVSSSLPPLPMTADAPEKSRPPVPSPRASAVDLHASGRRPGRGRRAVTGQLALPGPPHRRPRQSRGTSTFPACKSPARPVPTLPGAQLSSVTAPQWKVPFLEILPLLNYKRLERDKTA